MSYDKEVGKSGPHKKPHKEVPKHWPEPDHYPVEEPFGMNHDPQDGDPVDGVKLSQGHDPTDGHKPVPPGFDPGDGSHEPDEGLKGYGLRNYLRILELAEKTGLPRPGI